ncbi:MAG: transglutaminase domain-containing protein [Planctomycetes bacterium]|nr:transglutaminase domain-containing protein [Planctomycetota bacterium]
MRTPRLAAVAGLAFATAAGALVLPPVAADTAAKSRTFEFSYVATANAPADGATGALEVWMAIPQTSACQTISDLKIDAPFAYTISQEAEYGNAVLHGKIESFSAPATIKLTCNVARTELKRDLASLTGKPDPAEDLGPLARFLASDHLAPLDLVRKTAGELTQGKQATLDKARAIYDHVLGQMTYNKDGAVWGQGNLEFACSEKRGNCSDFHTLFIALARAAGIPARFEIGFPLPTDKKEGAIGGYHCWAQFYVPGNGWVPVDCSEARKHPELKDYYFGTLCENRVSFSAGRDLTLAPKQAAGPVNFLVYPYLELDGKPYDGLEKTFGFRDLPAPQ